jgi:hypothetical protein
MRMIAEIWIERLAAPLEAAARDGHASQAAAPPGPTTITPNGARS